MTEQTEIKYKKPTFHLIGRKGEILRYEELRPLLIYFQNIGYEILFIKEKRGWVIEIKKK